MAERRREDRNTCYMRADIILSEALPPIQAEVHDISEQGLKIRMADTSVLPDEFIVSIPRRHFRETVTVRRRSPDTLGCLIKRHMNKVA